MMKNDEEIHLTKQSWNIFKKIKNWLLRFKKKEDNKKTDKIKEYNKEFKNEIKIKKDKEQERILNIQKGFKEGTLLEEDISKKDYEKLLELYDKQNDEIKKEIEMYKLKTETVLKKMKRM